MIARIAAPARAFRRAALLLCGIGIAGGTLVAGPHMLPSGALPSGVLPHGALAGGHGGLRRGAPETTGAATAGEKTHRVVYPHTSGFADLAHTVKGAVIAIVARTTESDPLSRGHGLDSRSRLVTSQGSGFFISADGYAVTSNHVIKGAVSIEVRTETGYVYPARLVGADAISDLAVVKVDVPRAFDHVKFAEQPPRVGDWVIAVGNPFGLGGTVTAGIVSARGRDVEKESDTYEDMVQIDAPINKGNSGGPTFDLEGDVIGVNTVILSPTGGSIGIAFAIPADKAKEITDQLRDSGAVARGWLGIQFQSVVPEIADSLGLPDSAGILIADVQPKGPAARGGVTAGDLVDSVNGVAIRNAHDFSRAVDAVPPHAVVILGIRRKGRKEWLAVTTGTAPAPPPEALAAATTDGAATTAPEEPPPTGQPLGLKLLALSVIDSSEGRHGVMVVEVEPGGVAAGRGIDPGDLILDVADEAIGAPEDLYRLVDSAKSAGRHSILLRIKSGETAKFVALPIS